MKKESGNDVSFQVEAYFVKRGCILKLIPQFKVFHKSYIIFLILNFNTITSVLS